MANVAHVMRAASPRRLLSRSNTRLWSPRFFSAATDETTTTTPPLGTPYSQLTIGIPKETFPLEKRVAATPESVARLIKPGFNVQVQSGAGEASYFTNQDYEAAGATIVEDAWQSSDIVLKVRRD